LDEIEQVFESLGFETHHRSGSSCGLYAREDMAICCGISPTDAPRPYMFFTAGGDELGIRSALGKIGTDTSVSVVIDRWSPGLHT
jgi:hypothetical protein